VRQGHADVAVEAPTVAEQALDLTAVAAWMFASGTPVAEPLTATLIEGGRSNLTFFLTDRTLRRWVLRRPPLGQLLAGAHDVARECRVMQALAPTPVPVPPVIGLGSDASGTPFYVMDAVPGIVVRDGDEAADLLSPSARELSGRELMAGLAALHTVDPTAVGLERLGRGRDYLARQITSWQGQAEHHRTKPFPDADRVRERLLADLPPQDETTLVHGDYKLDNVILSPRGALAAILDWELATRGDPLVDLAVCVYYWTEFSDPVLPFDRPPSLLPGMADRTDLLGYYHQLTGRRLPRQDYYFAYAAWRLAMVLEGVAGRARAGAYGPLDHEEDARLGDVVRKLVHHAADLLERDHRRVDA